MLGSLALPRLNGLRPSLSRALIVTRRELRDSLRDWRILLPIVSLTIVLPSVLVLGLRASKDLIERLGPDTLNNKILPFSVLGVGFFPMTFSLVIALETFVGEKERNSLEALLTAPLTDLELFLGKYIAAVIPPIATSTIGMFIYVGLLLATGGPMPVTLPVLGVFWMLTAAQALVMVAGAVIVSSHTTSTRAANLLASFIILPMSVIVQLEAVILLVGQKKAMIAIWVALLIVLVILLRTGVRIFNREEIVAREGDSLNIKGIFRNLGGYFKRTPNESLARQTGNLSKFSLWRLYRRDIPQILVVNKYSILAVCLSIGVAILIGWWLSTWNEVQVFVNDKSGEVLAGSQNQLCSNLNSPLEVNGFGAITCLNLFINNVRAVLVGSFLSLLTLGSAGIILVMVSIGPIGLLGGAFGQLKLNVLGILVGFLVPHGVIELPAAIFAIAAALQMGSSYIAPPKGFTIGGSLLFAIVNYIKLLALVVPMLLVAAIIEANFSPVFGCWLTGGKY